MALTSLFRVLPTYILDEMMECKPLAIRICFDRGVVHVVETRAEAYKLLLPFFKELFQQETRAETRDLLLEAEGCFIEPYEEWGYYPLQACRAKQVEFERLKLNVQIVRICIRLYPRVGTYRPLKEGAYLLWKARRMGIGSYTDDVVRKILRDYASARSIKSFIDEWEDECLKKGGKVYLTKSGEILVYIGGMFHSSLELEDCKKLRILR